MNVLIGGCYRRNSGGAQCSPTFGRGGNAALFSVEIFDVDASTTMTVVVEHKNEEDTSWTTLATLASMSSGVNTQTASASKEQLRYAITIDGASASLSVYANVLAPQWRPYA
jgi:hypothetical protein